MKIRRLSAQETPGGQCARDCRCDRLVHFMGDRGGQLAHRRDAVGVREAKVQSWSAAFTRVDIDALPFRDRHRILDFTITPAELRSQV